VTDKRLVLAYSGGLDTSVAIRWLGEQKGYEVVACAVDVGQAQPGEMDRIRQRALACGAVDALVVDAKSEFAEDYVAHAIRANALYMGKYPLVSSLSRPLITSHLVRVAREIGAGAVAHGCTGKGNDQVRFEVAFGALAPDLEVLAPVRDWAMSRPEAIGYAEKHGIDIGWVSLDKPYSIDANLWGRTIEAGVLENPWHGVPEDAYELTRAPRSTDQVTEMTVTFERGVPVAVDGAHVSVVEAVGRLAEAGGAVGFGRVDMIENRRVGIKSREVYEVPGALALITAHRDLEDLTLERDLLRTKAQLEARYADLVYDGLWFSPLREALDAFMSQAQASVSGEVRLRFAPWSCQVVGRRSDRALYRPDLATYEQDDGFDHDAARGFVTLWGLPSRTWATVQGRP
jgi:argininosuccinate synthase